MSFACVNGLQTQTRGVANILFLLTLILLWFSNPSLCSSYAFTIPGLVNLQASPLSRLTIDCKKHGMASKIAYATVEER